MTFNTKPLSEPSQTDGLTDVESDLVNTRSSGHRAIDLCVVGHQPRGHDRSLRLRIIDRSFVCAARDAHVGIWSLQVAHCGSVKLELNQLIVATVSPRTGSAVLQAEGCPFERAADLIDAVTQNLNFAMSGDARAQLEFKLARWIPTYFDL